MANTFSKTHAAAWSKLGIGSREKPGEIFPKYTKKDFDQLKSDFNKEYGYTIRIPQWDDIVHLTPDALKTKQEIKAEKKEALTRILESPAPEWQRKYSTAMTWIDDIQDTSSVVYPLLKGLFKIAPKAFAKAAPIIGWLSTAYDILNILTAIGTAPLSPMKGKREVCKAWKNNPFSKEARLSRINHIKNWKPNWADAIQAAQVSDNLFGFGLSLGGIMGAITDSISGAYRYLNGEKVRWSFDPPDVGDLEKLGSRGMKAAAAISSQGQVFSETQHFWTYVTAALSSMLLSGWYHDNEISDIVQDVPNVALEAPTPTNPNTIEVIQEMGLSLEEGTGWPWNGQKIISVADYLDATAEPIRSNFHDFSMRHSKDSYGYVAAMAMDNLLPQTLLAVDPEAELEMDDTPFMKAIWKMIKAPILPARIMTDKEMNDFGGWTEAYYNAYEKAPGILEIEQKFKDLSIPYITSYPDKPTADFQKYFPPGWTGEESF